MAKKNITIPPRTTPMKFRDFTKLLRQHGYEPKEIRNSTHQRFYNANKNHSVVVSGCSHVVKYPIIAKILKETGIK